jgi:hypothetical protein
MMASAREKTAIAAKQIALRDQLWPAAEAHLWQRKVVKGFATIPKTFPLVLQIMDDMTKDTPVSRTYLALWCSTWDNGFVSLAKPKELALASGFTGQRMEYVWGTRMRLLKQLGFIDIKAGKSGPMSHAIIWNPHHVIRRHYAQKTPGLQEASYTSLVEWALEIGASDMTGALPEAWNEAAGRAAVAA